MESGRNREICYLPSLVVNQAEAGQVGSQSERGDSPAVAQGQERAPFSTVPHTLFLPPATWTQEGLGAAQR